MTALTIETPLFTLQPMVGETPWRGCEHSLAGFDGLDENGCFILTGSWSYREGLHEITHVNVYLAEVLVCQCAGIVDAELPAGVIPTRIHFKVPVEVKPSLLPPKPARPTLQLVHTTTED